MLGFQVTLCLLLLLYYYNSDEDLGLRFPLSGPQCLCLLSEDNHPSLKLCRALVKVRGQLAVDTSTRSMNKRAH